MRTSIKTAPVCSWETLKLHRGKLTYSFMGYAGYCESDHQNNVEDIKGRNLLV